jgi:hypothetical protein
MWRPHSTRFRLLSLDTQRRAARSSCTARRPLRTGGGTIAVAIGGHAAKDGKRKVFKESPGFA